MLNFLKSALFKGLLILLPVMFLIIILKEFLELLIALATPIADLFPRDVIEGIPETNILALLLIVGAALVLGILSMVPGVRRLGTWIDIRILDKVPVYRPLKGLLGALLGDEDSESFKPVFILGDSGELEPGYVIEDTGRPRVSVLVPWTPASFAGSLRFIPREKLHYLDLTFDEFSLVLGHYGVGLSDRLPDLSEDLKLDSSS